MASPKFWGTRLKHRAKPCNYQDLSASVCDRIDSITITESVDSTGYDSPETELPVGFARPIDDPNLPAMTEAGTAVFGDAVRLVADALGLALDDVHCEAEYARTTEDLDLGSWRIPAGCVAGIKQHVRAWHGEELLISLDLQMYVAAESPRDHVLVDGVPPIDMTINGGVAGDIATAAIVINCIPKLVAARPGLLTMKDMPLVHRFNPIEVRALKPGR